MGKPGAKLNRSETVTVRLDPKLRYLAELAARRQRRTVSSFIECAVATAITTVSINNMSTVADLSTKLWDVDEDARFVKLATQFPELLNYDEQIKWSKHGKNN